MTSLRAHPSRAANAAGDDEYSSLQDVLFGDRKAVFQSVQLFETRFDYWIGVGICINESDGREPTECFADPKDSRDEAIECAASARAATELCSSVGKAATIRSSRPRTSTRTSRNLDEPESLFPARHRQSLGVPQRHESTTGGGVERDQADRRGALHRRARRSHAKNGILIEGTNDWFAQAKDGNVWYCGEETASFETFKGDRPKKPELVSIDGSFKAGRDGDKPGIIFLASPTVGSVYIEESSLGNAEDATEILSSTIRSARTTARSAGAAGARAAAVRRQLRRHQKLLAARAGRVRAQVLRAGNRSIPRDGAGLGRSGTAREMQRRSALRISYRVPDAESEPWGSRPRWRSGGPASARPWERSRHPCRPIRPPLRSVERRPRRRPDSAPPHRRYNTRAHEAVDFRGGQIADRVRIGRDVTSHRLGRGERRRRKIP